MFFYLYNFLHLIKKEEGKRQSKERALSQSIERI